VIAPENSVLIPQGLAVAPRSQTADRRGDVRFSLKDRSSPNFYTM